MVALIAVLLMPLGMAAAPAAVPHRAATVEMPMQHCPEQGQGRDHKGGFAECTMACSGALPAVARADDQPILTVGARVAPVAVHRLHGLHPETATPPPRLS